MSEENKSNNGEEALDDQEMHKSASQARLEKYKLFVVKPEDVNPLWEAEDPSTMAQELLKDFLPVFSESLGGIDINYFSENETRYEPNQELKWLADFLINGLVLLKHDLAMEDVESISDVLQAMWETLDFMNVDDQLDQGGAAVHGRFTNL